MQVLKAYLSGPITANKYQQINRHVIHHIVIITIYIDRNKLGPITQTKCMISISLVHCIVDFLTSIFKIQ